MLKTFLLLPVLIFFFSALSGLAQGKAAKLAPGKPAQPVAVPAEPVSRAELLREAEEKLARVERFLQEQNLGGVLLSKVNNVAWVTAGLGDSHIVLTSEVGPASLLILRGGKKYLVANNTEVPHLLAQNFRELGYEPRPFAWYESVGGTDRKLEIVRELAAGQPVGTDVPYADLRPVEAALAPLRYRLTDPEIKKYRWVGQRSAEAVAAVCRQIRPGMTEKQIEALTTYELLQRGLQPTVVLVGVDERVLRYFHYPPTEKALQKYAIVNVCARRWGLTSSVARYVHFGPVPETLQQAMQASAAISAHMQAHTKPGLKAGEMLELTKKWYAQHGFPDGWQAIHVGGAIGYAEREWVAYPSSPEVLHTRQAFAWNPFTVGALSFDTVILHEDNSVENLTATPDWPSLPVSVGGRTFRMPGILVR